MRATFPDQVKLKKSTHDDVKRFAKHVYPHLKSVTIASVTRDAAKLVMSKLHAAATQVATCSRKAES